MILFRVFGGAGVLGAVLWGAGCAAPQAERVAPVAGGDVSPDSGSKAIAPSGSQLVREANAKQRGFQSGGVVRELSWDLDHAALYLTRGGERMRVDLNTMSLDAVTEGQEPDRAETSRSRHHDGPGRGRQRSAEPSPDGQWIARCVEWNVVLEPTESDDPEAERIAITTDGDRKQRYGSASWVYGEELVQQTAMWWSGDSRWLVFYSFDEQQVADFYLLDELSGLRSSILREGYPKAGEANPIASLMIHDLETGETRPLLQQTAEDDVYLYDIRITPDGNSLLASRTNRLQNELTLLEVELSSGAVHTVLTETQETWQDNRPFLQFLEDGERFIWASERSGFRQYELRTRSGTRLAELSGGAADVHSVVYCDEKAEQLWYLQADPDHPIDTHLWRVGFDGDGRTQITSGPGRRRIRTSPDGRWFVVRRESVSAPPHTTLLRVRDGAELELAAPNLDAIAALEWPTPELFTCLAADGVTTLYGILYKPRDFDSTQRYPLLIDVYGGPESQAITNRWRTSHTGCATGFLIAKIDNRGTGGRGKAFMGAVYRQLGSVDLADQVAGVRALGRRAYVDPDRVGIYGHSYGGYLAALAILKYPEVFAVAVASAAVTDWRNYDTIYTERYMQTPEQNLDGYDAGSCAAYAEQLTGQLLIQHGMLDDNVHPHNAWQLIDALQEADKTFDMMFYPDRRHRLPQHATSARWDFLYRHLQPARP